MIKKLLNLKKKVIALFNNYYPFSLILFLALIIIAAYGQLVNLYFWTDDWDLFLKIVHPELGLWGMDPGWFGSGPYRYLHTPFMPFYPLFGLNPTPYFAGEIIIYFVATVSVFLLSLELTRKKSLSIAIAAIYGSLGYIGSYTLFHLSNAFQNVGAVIFTTLTLWILAKHYRTNKFLFYPISISLFYASLEIENLRAHGLIFLVFGLTLLYAKWSKSILNIGFNLLKLIPFILIYKALYSATLGSGSSTTVGAFFHTMLRDNLYAYFIYPFASFSNVIIPDDITKFAYSVFGNTKSNIIPEIGLVVLLIFIGTFVYRKIKNYKLVILSVIVIEILYFLFNRWALKQPILTTLDPSAGFTSMFGMTILLSFLLITLVLWIKKNNFNKVILFGIVLIFGHYIGYFIGVPSYSYLITTDRYLTPSTVGTAVLLGTLFYLAYFRRIHLFAGLTVVYCLYLIIIMNFTINKVVGEVSNPTRKLYETIKNITPSITKNSILLLDIENTSNLRYLVGSSFPSTAFALFYGFPNRMPAVRSFEEYLYLVKMGKMRLDDLQSFFIGQWEITDTSKDIKHFLKNPQEDKVFDLSKWTSNTPFTNSSFFNTEAFVFERGEDTLGVNPQIDAVINHTSIVPSLVSLTMTANPINLENKQFPYNDVSSIMADQIIKEDLPNLVVEKSIEQSSCEDVSLYISMDKEREEFIKTANINTTSQTLYSEKEFLHDGLIETNWSGHVLDWANEKKAEIDIDFGFVKSITALIWVNYLERTTPTKYIILSSVDGKDWRKLKEVNNGSAKDDGEFVIENFPEVKTRYVKIIITDILIGSAPAISEIWTSSLGKAGQVKEFPSQLISSPMSCSPKNNYEYTGIINSMNGEVKTRIWWLSNSWDNFSVNNSKEINLIMDGRPHTYNIFIPAQGTILEKIRINNFQIPLDFTIQNASIRSLTFKEMDDMGYIRMPTGATN